MKLPIRIKAKPWGPCTYRPTALEPQQARSRPAIGTTILWKADLCPTHLRLGSDTHEIDRVGVRYSRMPLECLH
jgi:hypothetical protein